MFAVATDTVSRIIVADMKVLFSVTAANSHSVVDRLFCHYDEFVCLYTVTPEFTSRYDW